MFYLNLFFAILFIGALPFTWFYDKNLEDTKMELVQEKKRTEKNTEINIKDLVRELKKIPLDRSANVVMDEDGKVIVQVYQVKPF